MKRMTVPEVPFALDSGVARSECDLA